MCRVRFHATQKIQDGAYVGVMRAVEKGGHITTGGIVPFRVSFFQFFQPFVVQSSDGFGQIPVHAGVVQINGTGAGGGAFEGWGEG